MTIAQQAAAPRHVTAPSLMRTAIRALAAIAPPLAVRAAARLFRYPVRPRASALPGERFAVRAGRHTVRGGVREPWGSSVPRLLGSSGGRDRGTEQPRDRGTNGPLVILVHGWGGSEQQFDVLGDALVQRGFRVVTFSAIGHGASSSRFSSMVELRDSLLAVAAHFAAGPYAVIGHSLGGAASALAVSEGLRTSRLVLIAASAHPRRYLGNFLDWLEFPHQLRARVVRHFEKTLRFAWDRLDIEAIGPLVHVPTLIIHDRADREVPYSEGADAARLIPDAQLVTVETLGHRRILRDAGVVERIAQFLG